MRNIKNGILPIIIVPSRISLEKQTTQRFVDETQYDEDDDDFFSFDDEDDEDEYKELENMKKNFLDNSKNIKEHHIGRFDTGIPKKQRLGNPKDIMEKYKNGDVRLIIVLDNSQGIKKLCSLLSYIDVKHPRQSVSIIVDEIHNLLNLKFTTDEAGSYRDELYILKSTVRTVYNRFDFVKPNNFHNRKVINTL